MGSLFGLFGHPVGHSMSPVMHNDAFNNLGLPHVYQAFDVHPNDLGNAVEGIRALGIAGFNVTIPHKVAIMQFLDEIDEDAKKIGAVNTVKNMDGKLIGYNTDGDGFYLSLKRLVKAEISNKKVLIIGAGGAARGIYVALINNGVEIVDLANRTVEKAKQLAKDTNVSEYTTALSLAEAEAELGSYDIVINTTSVGMSPNIGDVPLSLKNVKKGTVLSDIIYNPLETKWLKEGKEKGCITQNGVGMFVGQGAIAFEIWTGQKPDMARMEQIVIDQLGG